MDVTTCHAAVAIPPEVACRIFGYLTATDLCRVGGVCRSWRAMSSDPMLWRGFYRETCCQVWPPDDLDSIDLRAEVIEAINLSVEWERDRREQLNKARERFVAEGCIRLSSAPRVGFSTLRPLKVVIVGDSGVGKTALIQTWSTGSDILPRTVAIKGGLDVVVNPSEAPGGSVLRPTDQNADVFLLCYSVVEPASLEHLRTRWHPQVKRCCPNAPLVVVGIKREHVSEDKGTSPGEAEDEYDGGKAGGDDVPSSAATPQEPPTRVPQEQALVLAFDMDAVAYAECGAREDNDVAQLMSLAANFAVYEPQNIVADRGRGGCLLQ